MTTALTHLLKTSLLIGGALLTFAASPTAQAMEIKHTVSHTDLCRVNPIRHAPLRASKDAVLGADLGVREAMGAEVRARGQMETAEEHFAELQASYGTREELREARAYLNWAHMEHDLAQARLEQAEAEYVLSRAELELGKLQLMEVYSVEASARYRESRFEDQLEQAQLQYDRKTERVERLERRIAGARSSWENLAAR